jgi:hypothetical protein
MLTFGLHPFGWNRPELCIEIDLCPPSAEASEGAQGSEVATQ